MNKKKSISLKRTAPRATCGVARGAVTKVKYNPSHTPNSHLEAIVITLLHESTPLVRSTPIEVKPMEGYPSIQKDIKRITPILANNQYQPAPLYTVTITKNPLCCPNTPKKILTLANIKTGKQYTHPTA